MRILTFLLLMIPGVALAQLSHNLFLDAKAMSLGNAITADPTGVMNIHFNPAGLTKLEGRQVEFKLMNIYLNVETEFSLPEKAQKNCGNDLLDICNDPVINKGTSENPEFVTAKSKASAAVYIPGVGIQSSDLPFSPLPTGGVSIQPEGSKFTFANAAYIPMAAGFYREDDDAGRYQGKQISLQRVTYLSPSFGYKVNDQLSLGVGFLFSHQTVAVRQNVRAPSMLIGVLGMLQDAFGCRFLDSGRPDPNASGQDPLSPIITLCGGKIGPYSDVGELSIETTESLSPSFNLGLLWEPTDWFAFGVGYQSEAKANLKGDFKMTYSDGFAGFFAGLRSSIVGAIAAPMFGLPIGLKEEKGHVSTELTYPQHLQLGVKFRAFDRLQLNVDAGWTDLKEWEALEFQFDRKLDFLSAGKTTAPGLLTDTSLKQEMEYRSVWSFGFGLAYDLNSRTQLRFGYEPRETSIPTDRRSMQAPLGFAKLYSMGLGYQWDKDTVVDFSVSFMQSKENIWADPIDDFSDEFPTSSNSINRSCLTCSVSNPYPGLDVKTSLTIGAVGLSFRTKF